MRGLARQDAVALVAGFPDARLVAGDETRTEGRRYLRFNAAGLFNTHGTLVDTYGKHHLVPVGEAMPFQRLIPILGDLDVGQAEWTQGEPPGPLALTTPAGEVPIFVLICYEAVFSDLARQAVRRGGAVLVNITNDGWFGRTAGPRQHAALARIRAVECGVPLVRCANNGISMICDADGVILDRLDLDRRGLVQATIATVARETWYVRTGIWPALIYLVLWALVGLWLARRGDDGESEEAA